MRRTKRASGETGFSLLEVLAAMAVLAFGVLGMAQLFILAIDQNRKAATHTQSSNMLQHRMEQLRQMDFCALCQEAEADGGAWVPDEPIEWTNDYTPSRPNAKVNENMGQSSLDVFTRKDLGQTLDKTVGLGQDWVIERRLIHGKQGMGEIDKQPIGELTILIELRGYRRGYRQNYAGGKNQFINLSGYRTKRSPAACSPSPCP